MKGKKESLVTSDFKIQLLSRPGNNPLGLYHHRVLKNGRRGRRRSWSVLGRPCGGRAVVDSQAVLDSMQRMEGRGAKVMEIFNFWKSSTQETVATDLLFKGWGSSRLFTTVPSLFGMKARFRGRRFFHGWCFWMIQAHYVYFAAAPQH